MSENKKWDAATSLVNIKSNTMKNFNSYMLIGIAAWHFLKMWELYFCIKFKRGMPLSVMQRTNANSTSCVDFEIATSLIDIEDAHWS